jgi:hypothetical protein
MSSLGLLPDGCGDLFRLAEHQDKIRWIPYKNGVEIFRLYGDGVTGPGAALRRQPSRDEAQSKQLNREKNGTALSRLPVQAARFRLR